MQLPNLRDRILSAQIAMEDQGGLGSFEESKQDEVEENEEELCPFSP